MIANQPLLRNWPRKLPNSAILRKIMAITPFKVIQGHRFWYLAEGDFFKTDRQTDRHTDKHTDRRTLIKRIPAYRLHGSRAGEYQFFYFDHTLRTLLRSYRMNRLELAGW